MKRVVTFGELMMRLATPDHLRFEQATNLETTYGGAESNVAVSLSKLGLNTRFVTRLPENAFGNAALGELKKHDVNTAFIAQGGDRLGIYFLETGAVGRGSKVIYDRADSAFATIQPGMIDWDAVFADADWFHWTGITPAVSKSAAAVCKEAILKAAEKGLTISTDLNYRAKLWNWGKDANEVMEDLVSYCDIILGNEEDAEKVFGIKADGDITAGHVEASAYTSVCQQLMTKFPKATKIVVTLRGSISASHNTWSGVLWNGDELISGTTYDITHIVDRVGGGDSFMAGLIYGLTTWPNDDKKALNFAIAASCLKHTIKGDFNLVTKEEVEKLMAGDGSGRVVR